MNTHSIISQYVALPSTSTSKGWYTLKCKICNDYKRRAAFLFENDDSIAYNCFNCPHDAKFVLTTHTSVPDSMKKVFDAFGIPEDDFKEAMFANFVANKRDLVLTTSDVAPIKYNNLEFPKFIRPLNTSPTGNVWDQLVCDYLEYDRGIDPNSYTFYIADQSFLDSSKVSKALWEKWKGRVIVPYYRNNNLIFYQGRDVINSDRIKYMTPSDSKDAVMYGFHELYQNFDQPLFIHEGFFDAFLLGNSVAVFGNKMTDNQIALLNKCPRTKVVIPDRSGKGYIIANQALREGWSVSFPDIGTDCKDINDAINKYGKLYVSRSVMAEIKSDFAAQVAVNMYCKK